MPASSGRRFALEISADLNRLATDRKHNQAKANAQSNDDDLAAAVTRRDHDTLFLDTLVNLSMPQPTAYLLSKNLWLIPSYTALRRLRHQPNDLAPVVMVLDNGVSTAYARDGLSVEHIIWLRIMGASGSIGVPRSARCAHRLIGNLLGLIAQPDLNY